MQVRDYRRECIARLAGPDYRTARRVEKIRRNNQTAGVGFFGLCEGFAIADERNFGWSG